MFKLSAEYEAIYNSLLATIASSSQDSQDPLSLFWPMRGHQYDGDLFVIGRTLNGADVNENKKEFAQVQERQRIITELRGIAEPIGCPMLWLTDPDRYHWKGSAFFRVMEKVSLRTDSKRGGNWASWICWSNLLKVGPTSRHIQPSKALKDIELSHGIRLIAQELAEFNPRRVLVLAGRDWFSPFEQGLGVKVKWRPGLVEGIGSDTNRRWVIAKHPMLKPEGTYVDEVLEAFAARLRD